jgi:thiamine biosynthesis lipoprotein
MGTEIALVCPDMPFAERRLDLAERWTSAYEGRLSRFIPYSELSRLNRSAGKPFIASTLLFEFVLTCLELAQRSGGVFDPTLLPEIEAAGYDRTFDLIPSTVRPRKAGPRPTFREVRFDAASREIILPPGLGIDSGGLGKGWAADRLARFLGRDCLVDCGGDIAVNGRPPDAPAWYVGVQDPFAPERDLAMLAVSGRGVATSSVLKRRWLTDTGSAHHLIDPKTGVPSTSDLAAVTVIAPDAKMADFHAKVALLKGSAEGGAYIEGEAGVEGLLVCRDGARKQTAGFERYLVQP